MAIVVKITSNQAALLGRLASAPMRVQVPSESYSDLMALVSAGLARAGAEFTEGNVRMQRFFAYGSFVIMQPYAASYDGSEPGLRETNPFVDDSMAGIPVVDMNAAQSNAYFTMLDREPHLFEIGTDPWTAVMYLAKQGIVTPGQSVVNGSAFLQQFTMTGPNVLINHVEG